MDLSENDENNGDEWELSKENVLPLRQGRKFSNLSAALQTSAASANASTKQKEKQAFETELRTYSGDDPLDVWDRYLKWSEQNFPKGDKESNQKEILERCVVQFRDNAKYTNDPRYLNMWIKFMRFTEEPLVIFDFLHAHGIGCELAAFYETWASFLEVVGNTKKADQIYSEGIARNAQPLETLQRKHRELQARVMRGVMATYSNDEASVDESREALNALKARGRHAPIERAGTGRPGGGGVGTKPLQTSNAARSLVNVYCDEEDSASCLPPQSREYASHPSEVDRAENTSQPGPWNKARMKQKSVSRTPATPAPPQFSVHEDTGLPQPKATPRKVCQTEAVLSAKKVSKPADVVQQLQPASSERREHVMYCKDKVYGGTEEFQLEELRAAWWTRHRQEELRRQQEEQARLQQYEQRMERVLAAKQAAMEEQVAQHKRALEEQYKAQLLQQQQQLAALALAAEPQEKAASVNSSCNSSHTSGSVVIFEEPSSEGQGLADRGQGLADRGKRLADRGQGLGDRCEGLAERGAGLGDSGQGIATRGQGLGDRGQGVNTVASENVDTSSRPMPYAASLDDSMGESDSVTRSQPITPSSDLSLPRGPSITPSSDLSLPRGPSITPSSDLSLPRGPSITPSSDLSLPHGPSITPSSDLSLPHGPSITPSSDLSLPHGPSITPSSDLSMPSSATITPSSDFSLPSSSTITPSGFGSGASVGSGPLHSGHQYPSHMNASLRSGRPSLTAPSPTVNTKEAYRVVMGMFNTSCGVDSIVTHNDDFEDQFSLKPQDGVSRQPYKVYDVDSSVLSDKPPTCPPPTQAAEDKENCGQFVKPTGPPRKAPTARSFGAPTGAFGGLASGMGPSASGMGPSASGMGPGASGMGCALPSMKNMDPDVDMADHTDILAGPKAYSAEEQAQVMECSMQAEVTFAPEFSSTRNFNEMARLVSTPFNAQGTVAPLDAPPMSSIKAPELQKTYETSSILREQPSVGKTSEESCNLRRSSMFSHNTEVANLSPIIEQSDEDMQSTVSSQSTASSHSSAAGFHTTAASFHFTAASSKSTTAGSQSTLANSHTSTASSQSAADIHSTTTTKFFPDSKPPSTDVTNSHKPKIPTSNTSQPTTTVTDQATSDHQISLHGYHPPAHQVDLNMSVAINLNDPFDSDIIRNFLSTLDEPLERHPNYHAMDCDMPNFRVNGKVVLGRTYNIRKLLGKGGFAKVYSCETEDDSMHPDDEDKVIKVQQPGCPWEFYICDTLQKRLTNCQQLFDVRSSVMTVDEGYFFNNGSCLINQQHNGSLLDLVNWYKKQGTTVPIFLAAYITVELLHTVEQMHRCGIIHGDIKPDNFLIQNVPCLPPDEGMSYLLEGRAARMVKLIDYGHSIDMNMYPPGTTFTAKVDTSDFQCIEMKTNRPWTYQIDHFGLAGTVHVLLLNVYMKVHANKNQQSWGLPLSVIKRYWGGYEAWRKLFHDLLNIPSCEQQPDLAAIRQMLETYLRDKVDVSTFNNCMQELRMMMYDSCSMA